MFPDGTEFASWLYYKWVNPPKPAVPPMKRPAAATATATEKAGDVDGPTAPARKRPAAAPRDEELHTHVRESAARTASHGTCVRAYIIIACAYG